MNDFETLMEKVKKQAIEDAARIDPTFAEKVAADRREIEEHEKRLQARRDAAKRKEEPAEAAQRRRIWDRMIESQK